MAATATLIRFTAKLKRPVDAKEDSWTFLNLPIEASEKLPTRSKCSIEGKMNGKPFQATLDPDGQGGHWLRVSQKLEDFTGVKAGDLIDFEIAPAAVEPEPEIPEDFQTALDQSSPKAQDTWRATTAIARRDWIHWITSGKKEETRIKRLNVAIDKLSKGKKRACCFDRSGMFDKSLSCPIATDDE